MLINAWRGVGSGVPGGDLHRGIRELKHVGRQHNDDGNKYNESMKRKK
jgi:hypothetical protein